MCCGRPECVLSFVKFALTMLKRCRIGTGKSSLIEGIRYVRGGGCLFISQILISIASEIKVPRKADTCTRVSNGLQLKAFGPQAD